MFLYSETILQSNTRVPQKSILPLSCRPPPNPPHSCCCPSYTISTFTRSPARKAEVGAAASTRGSGLDRTTNIRCCDTVHAYLSVWGRQDSSATTWGNPSQTGEIFLVWSGSGCEHLPSMQVITCALFTLVALPVSSVSEADSCPAVCECSEWKSHTISCFDIDILPRFPASTETL